MNEAPTFDELKARAQNMVVEIPPASPPPPVNTQTGLAPYTGAFGLQQAGHLLRRTTFGANKTLVKQVQQMGLSAAVTQLLADLPLPAPPLNYNNDGDPAPVGATWVDREWNDDNNIIGSRFTSLLAWQHDLIYKEQISLREKMTLFWHNHFVIQFEPVLDSRFIYKNNTLLRANAFGNFKQLVKDITIDPAMLIYLNGDQNSRQAPNENYARELLELFTIGKGEQVGPGDYTTFTEDDVSAIAKVLTGWVPVGFFTRNPDQEVNAIFRTNRHDRTAKRLSNRFGNVIINNADADEYSNLIDIIFEKREAAEFISRKLYRWFLYYEITADIEANVIQPMADLLIRNNWEIKPVLEVLLQSEHFFDTLSLGPMIKNPIDFILGVFKQLDIPVPTILNSRYAFFNEIASYSTALQMTYFDPPDVAGWKAFYQQPSYYRTWINSTTLPFRMIITDALSITGVSFRQNTYGVNVFELAASLDDPFDPNAMIQELADLLTPLSITESQRDFLKSILIPGLPDFEWTVEYTDYLANPDDANLAAVVEFRLRLMLRALLNMPEYYLS